MEYFHKGHVLLLEGVRSAFYKELQFHCSSCTCMVPHYWSSKMYFVGSYHTIQWTFDTLCTFFFFYIRCRYMSPLLLLSKREVSGVSQPEERNCSVVWWFSSGYLCIFCGMAVGWTDCGGCCFLSCLELCADTDITQACPQLCQPNHQW